MNCSLSKVQQLIALAIGLLIGAIALAYFWVAAIPLFAAAAMVATVAYVLIPQIKDALLAYAACRGPSDKCRIALGIDTLGQAAATLSVVAFAAAAVMQVAALAFLYSWILSSLGVALSAAVSYMVVSGIFSCAITVLILIGVLTNANSFKDCMDQLNPNDPTVPPRRPSTIG